MKNPRLKPCPFCGSKDIFIQVDSMKQYNVFCHDCFASSTMCFSKKEAIIQWNKRLKMEAQNENHPIWKSGTYNSTYESLDGFGFFDWKEGYQSSYFRYGVLPVLSMNKNLIQVCPRCDRNDVYGGDNHECVPKENEDYCC